MANILYVEDNAVLNLDTTYDLESRGHTVHSTMSVEEACEEFDRTRGQFDLVLTDLNLFDKTAVEAITHIRKTNTSIPILVITSLPAQWRQLQLKNPVLLDDIEVIEKEDNRLSLLNVIQRTLDKSAFTRMYVPAAPEVHVA